MRIQRRIQRIIIGTFGVILALPGLTMLLKSGTPWWFHAMGLGLTAVVLAPSVAFLCGVDWCRFVVGALSAIFFLFWSLSPLMQHAIDRNVGFWFLWGVIEVVLVSTLVVAFRRTSEAQDAA